MTAPFPSLVVGDFNPGLSISFNQTTGHALGDSWSFTGQPDNVVVPISTQTGQVGVQRARDALHQAIEQQKDFGLLSIRASAEGTVDKLYLTHTMDRLIDHSISVTGTSLTSSTTSVGEIVLIEDNDNFIRREHSFGLPDYPFGTTWRPEHLVSITFMPWLEIKISQNLILSAPIKITSTSSTGFLPEITMNKVATNMVYTGPTSVSLQATATDRDGHIQQVAFYENGRLIDTVVASPYSTSMDINASGMYEVYAALVMMMAMI